MQIGMAAQSATLQAIAAALTDVGNRGLQVSKAPSR
jgi:hypothetical protein